MPEAVWQYTANVQFVYQTNSELENLQWIGGVGVMCLDANIQYSQLGLEGKAAVAIVCRLCESGTQK